MDGNHRVQPIAFYLPPVENYAYWALFLGMIRQAGIDPDSLHDLVVISDQGYGLVAAVKAVLGSCEHTPCAVHRERHFQEEWKKAHGELSEDDIGAIEVLNTMVSYFRKAYLAIREEDCIRWLQRAADLEASYSDQHGYNKVRIEHQNDE